MKTLEEQFKEKYKQEDGEPKEAFIEFLKSKIADKENKAKDIKEKNALETFKDLPNRFISLIWNLISRWGIILGLSFFLIMKGVLGNWYSVVAWLVFSLFFLFKTEAPDMIEKILKIKELK